MSDSEDVLAEAGLQILERIRLRPEWPTLDAQARSLLAEAAQDAAELTLLRLAGHDVEHELAHAKAAVANWTFVQAATARSLLREVLEEVAGVAGALLRGFVLGR